MTSRIPHPYNEGDAETFLALAVEHRFVIQRKSDSLFLGMIGLQAERLLIAERRLLEPVERRQDDALVDESVHVGRPRLQGALKAREGQSGLAEKASRKS